MRPDTWKVLLFLIGAVINGTYQLQDVKRYRGTSKKARQSAYTIHTDNHEHFNLTPSQHNEKFVAGLFDNTRKPRHTEKDMNIPEKSKFRNANNLVHPKKHMGLTHKTQSQLSHKDIYGKARTNSYVLPVGPDTAFSRPSVPPLNIYQGNNSEVHRHHAKHQNYNSMTNSSRTSSDEITGLIVVNISREFTTLVNAPTNEMKIVKSNTTQPLNVTSERITTSDFNETKIFDDVIEKTVGRWKRKSLGNELGDIANVYFNESIINRQAAMINDRNTTFVKSSSDEQTSGTERTFSEMQRDISSLNLFENNKTVTLKTISVEKLSTMNANNPIVSRENENVSVSSFLNKSFKEKIIDNQKLIENNKYIWVNLTFHDHERRESVTSKDNLKHTPSMEIGKKQTISDKDINLQSLPATLQQITLLPQNLYEKIPTDNESLPLISLTDNDNIMSFDHVIETSSKFPVSEKLEHGFNAKMESVDLQFTVTTIGYQNISLMNHTVVVDVNVENISEKYVANNNRTPKQNFLYNGYHEVPGSTDTEFFANLHKGDQVSGNMNDSIFKSQNPITFRQENTSSNILEFSTSFSKLIERDDDKKFAQGTFREMRDNAPNDRTVTVFLPIVERLENMKKKEPVSKYPNLYTPSVFLFGLMKNAKDDDSDVHLPVKSLEIFDKSTTNDALVSFMEPSEDPSSTSRTIGEKSNRTWNLLPEEDFYIVGSFGFFDGNADDAIIEFEDNSVKKTKLFADQLENISTDSLLYADSGNAYDNPDAIDFISVAPVQLHLQLGEKLSVGSIAQERNIIDEDLYHERVYLTSNTNNIDKKETKNLKNSITSSIGNRNYGNASPTFLEALLFPISCAIVITSIILTAIGISYKRTYRLNQSHFPIEMLGRFEKRKVKNVEVVA